MKNMFIFCLLLQFCSLLKADEVYFSILPKPKIIDIRRAHLSLQTGRLKLRLAVPDSNRIEIAVQQLKNVLKFNDTDNESTGELWFGFPAADAGFERMCRELDLWPEDRIGGEGYVLSIDRQRVILAANTSAGLFYAVQSLKQLVRGLGTETRLPCLRIVDWPDLGYRGIMDDISRGPVPTLEFMKRQVQRLSELKINLLSYYTEHVVATASHGDFAPAGGAVTMKEWKELSDFASCYFIQLAGNFQSLGHFEKILALPQYRPLGDTDRMLSPVSEESFRFIREIYAEMIPVFSAPFFMINCDESWDLGRGTSKTLVDCTGVAEVYADHVTRLNQEVNRYGRRAHLWGDMALEHRDLLKRLPHDIILGAWDYSAYPSFADFFLPFKDAGYDFTVSPGVLNSNRLMPDFRMSFTNIINFIRDGFSHGAMGALTTVWDDGGKAFFSLDWYGLACAADQSWHVHDEFPDDFNHRYDISVYGDQNRKVSCILSELMQLTDLAPTQEMNEAIFWKHLLPAPGDKSQLSLTDWDSIRQITENAKDMLKESMVRIHAEDLDYLRFTIDQYRFMADARESIAEAAEQYRSACLKQRNDRTSARSRLVEALRRLMEVANRLTALRDEYRILWLRENRSYSLDHVLTQYDERIGELKDADNRLMAAVADFDQGHYLPPPQDVRLSIEIASGHYFQHWLLCGPFPNANGIDHLQPLGGELNARPRPGLQFQTADGKSYRWTNYTSPFESEIYPADIFDANSDACVYAYCRIESPVDQRIRATLGSHDGIEVMCNARRIYGRHIRRSLRVDEDEIMLPLKKGTNHLLLKIDQNKGEWRFSFCLPDHDVRNHKYKYQLKF